ncbi:alpha/beta fold hydrolase [Flagellimonas nanhaiensis]|uniref:Alpha/beta fold hydrolase n=2 Tax=Flagellimonas nanhaiensis TaxID=2292706 RepID=A0A371JS03_9FLAO|nr:alpha/beta fold hydrolase [Allomuricauda nanhaiensis]
MIAPATGIKKEFYSAFALFLAENGFATLTFDNRGIGESKGDSINSSNASLANWGKLDMTAVLEYLKNEIPNTNYHLIGHSAGGQLVGLMKNATELKSMFNFGSSSGSLHYSKYPFRLKSSFWLNFYIPVSNLVFGHTKSQWVGMGEPLPKNVGKEWTKWCNGKGYVKVDLDTKIKDHLYNELNLNSLWIHAMDDEIANYENVKDMIRVYPNIKSKILTLSPKEYGFTDIGHMKFFSKKKKELWNMATKWLNEN